MPATHFGVSQWMLFKAARSSSPAISGWPVNNRVRFITQSRHHKRICNDQCLPGSMTHSHPSPRTWLVYRSAYFANIGYKFHTGIPTRFKVFELWITTRWCSAWQWRGMTQRVHFVQIDSSCRCPAHSHQHTSRKGGNQQQKLISHHRVTDVHTGCQKQYTRWNCSLFH